MKDTTFNDVIEIKDTFNVNSFLKKLRRENPELENQKLNSIFLDHMFARTENPSDSKISQNYLNGVHEASQILLDLAKTIHSVDNDESNLNHTNHILNGSKRKSLMRSNFKTSCLTGVMTRMKNLIGLINAEKFNFEDLEAWRMGSVMDRRFNDHWKVRSDELNYFRIECKQKIDAGDIQSVGELFEQIDGKQNRIIVEEKTSIDSIKEIELDAFYKHKLFGQLKDQIENHSRSMKNTLERDLNRHFHEIEKQNGKFSKDVLEKTILDTIERMDALNNHLDDIQLNALFQKFWESEHVIGSSELQQLKQINAKTYREQKTSYRQYIKQGFEAAFDSEQDGVAVKREFIRFTAFEKWKFSEKDLLAIKVMKDTTYFEKQGFWSHTLKRFMERKDTKNYDSCMSQILSRFENLIARDPYTMHGYDGDVDSSKVRDLCILFRNSITKVTDEYDITQYTKPIFRVHCIAFASQMLLSRINENSRLSQLKNDPVNQLNEDKPKYQKLFQMKLLGAQRSQIWQQQLEDFFKEALVQIYLRVDESYATHNVIDEFIKMASRNTRKSYDILFISVEDLSRVFLSKLIVKSLKVFQI